MKLSLIHATRGRPQRCLDVRKEWLDKAIHPELVEHIFGVDADDSETIDAVAPFQRVIALPPKGCFAAFNLAAAVSTGALIIPIEDDLHPEPGWDEQIREAMAPHINEIAVLAVNDTQNDCIEWAITRKFYEARGLYHPDYFGLFGDTEWRVRAREDQILTVRAPHIVLAHLQFKPGSGTDLVYERKQRLYLVDELTFNQRQREGWP